MRTELFTKQLFINFAILLMAFLVSFETQAQITVQIGAGTNSPATTLYGPMYRFGATSSTTGSRANMLYTQAEMAAAGIPNGAIITQVEFNKLSDANFTTGVDFFEMNVANTSNTSLATTLTWATVLSTHTNVMTVNGFNLPNTTGWVPFVFSAPFAYTGDAFEVATGYTKGTTGSTSNIPWQFTSGLASQIVGASTATAATLNGTSTLYKERPNIRITYILPTACSGTPNAGTTISDINPVCPNAGFSLSLFGATAENGLDYQWESSADDVTYTPIGGAVSSFLATSQAVSTYYRCVVTCTNSSLSDTSIPLLVNSPSLVSGNFTIDKNNITQGTNFASFADAIDFVACGISGPVVFNVVAASGPYNEQVVIPAISNTSSTNTVTFNGNGNSIVYLSTNTNERAGIKLDGANWTRINDLNIIATGTTTSEYGWGIHFANGSSNNIIDGCNITLDNATTSLNYIGIIASGSNSSTTTAGIGIDENTIQNCTISGGYHGLFFYGNGVTTQIVNNRFLDNTITDFYSAGIYVYGVDGHQVTGNDISRPIRSVYTTTYGIYALTGTRGSLFSKNKIHDLFAGNTASTSTGYGMYQTAADGTFGNENRFVNNLVYNMISSGTIYGNYNTTSDYCLYYHNTFSLDDVNATTTSATYGFYQTTAAAGMELKNNIITVSRGGAGTKYCMYFATASPGMVSDNNDLFMNAAAGTNSVAYISGTTSPGPALPTLTDLQSKGWDLNSVSGDPLYSGPNVGDFSPLAVVVDDIGTGVGVSDDINGNSRSGSTPDPGAYEFTAPSLEASISYVGPLPPLATGNHPVTVNISNLSPATTITDLNLSFSDGVITNTESFSVSIAAGANQNVAFVTPYNLTGPVPMRAWINSVNTVSDFNQSNDTTLTQNICPGLSGVYTIDALSPASASNFQTFAAAISEMLNCGVAGPVTVNVVAASGPYNEQVVIPALPGVSAVNTVTFNGNGETLTFNSTNTSMRAGFRLDGASWIRINNFNIEATGTYGFGVQLLSNSTNNIIDGCTTNVDQTSTSANYAGIVASGSVSSATTAGLGIDNNTVQNCVINGGYYGISFYGNGATTQLMNNSILNNQVRGWYFYGVYIYGVDGQQVTGNEITRPIRSVTTATYGVYMSTGTRNSIVNRNRIYNLLGGNLTSTAATYAIYMTGADATAGFENRIQNNLIYKMRSNGAVYGIYNSSSDHCLMYHNTIAIEDLSSTATAEARGFYQTTLATGLDFRNNIVTIRRSGTGAKHCIYLATATTFINSNNNDLYVNSPAGNNNVAYLAGATSPGPDLPTLANLQSKGYDLNSVSADPLYAGINVDDYTPVAVAVDNKGGNVGVGSDFFGNPRNFTTPDPGAIEFAAPTLEAGIAWVSPVNPLTAGNHVVTVNINNLSPASTLTDLNLSYSDGVTTNTEAFTVSIAASSNQNVSFVTPYNLSSAASIRAWINSVNGGSDGNQGNDTTATQFICSGLVGNYNINPAAPASANNYQSYSAAIADLIACGVSGHVVFDVNPGAGTLTEQVVIPAINGAGPSATITFNGNGTDLSHSSTNTNSRATIFLNGASYITFEDLNIIAAGSGTNFGWGIQMFSNTNNITINNCTVTVDQVATTANFIGIVMSGSNTSATTAGLNMHNIKIRNTTVSGGYYSIIHYGNGTTTQSLGYEISDCILKDFYFYGIYAYGVDGALIQRNEVLRDTRTIVTTTYGIYLGTGARGTLVQLNRVHDLFAASLTSTSTSYGLYSTAADATSGNENRFVNNLVYNIENNGISYGIYNSSSDYNLYYHNTISLDHDASAATGATYGFYQTTAAVGMELRNNIITITRGGSGIKYGTYYATAGPGIVSNNNDIYVNSASGTNNTGYLAGATSPGPALPTLADLQGKGFDIQSVSVDPLYVDPLNVDFTPGSSSVNNVGAGVGVLVDFLGNPRDASFPDPGAFEFTPSGLDASISWVSPQSPVPAGPQVVTVNISNTQTVTITDLDLTYTDGITTVNEVFSSLNIPASGNQNIAFTTSFNISGAHSLRAYINSVNTITDNDQVNDTTATFNLCPALVGNYSIDASQAASATNFVTFTDAVNAMTSCGIAGAVVFDVAVSSGPYTEQITIPAIIGAGPASTITFNGNGETLTYNSAISAARGGITFNGARYITVNDLVVNPTGTYGFGFHLLNGSTNNTIQNCTVNNEMTSTATNYAGVVASGSLTSATTAGTGINNNQVIGCTFNGGYYGVIFYGNGTSSQLLNNQIEDNTIRDYYGYGVYIYGFDAGLVQGNDISRPNRTNSTTHYGIYANTGTRGTTINANRIHNTFDSFTTSTSANYGIYSNGADGTIGNEVMITNNAIYNMNSNGIIYALYNSSSDYNLYFHNTISLDDQGATTTSATRGFYQITLATGIQFRNNLISITRSGTGTKHGTYWATSGMTWVMNNNNYYLSAPGTNNIGYISGATSPGPEIPTLAEMQGKGFDLNSYTLNPMFADALNGDLQPTNLLIDDLGENVSITTDINGAVRSGTTPDIGAYEWAPPACVAPPTAGTVTANYTTWCQGGSSVLTLTGTSTGTGITIQWEESPNGSSWSNVTGGTGANSAVYTTPALGSTTHYRAAVTCSGNTQNSNPVIITVSPAVAAPITTGDSRCGIGVVNLSASGGTGGHYWLESLQPGVILSQGNTYSPNISATTNFQVLDHDGTADAFVGDVSPYVGDTSSAAFTNGQIFSVLNPAGIILKSIDVYPGALSTIGNAMDIVLFNSGGTPLTSISTTVTVAYGGVQTVDLNFYIPTGTGYRLAGGVNIPNLIRNTTGSVYPQTIPGQISITGNDFVTQPNPRWYFFYNWKVSNGCFSPAAVVTGTVVPGPALVVTPAGSTTFCAGGSVDLAASGYTDYTWSPAAGLSATTGSTVTASPATTTTYTVIGTEPGGCSAQEQVTITVNPLPFVTASIDGPSTICINSSVGFNAIASSNIERQIGFNQNIATALNYVYSGANVSERIQMIYLSSELSSSGLTAGNITRLGFEIAQKTSTAPYNAFTIKMAHTATSVLPAAFATATFTTVYSANYSSVLGWNYHTFSTPFNWNGSSNILIEICYTNTAAVGNDFVWTTPTSFNQMVFNNGGGCAATAATQSLNRPNIRLFGGNVTYSWSPATDLSATNIPNPILTATTTGIKTYTVTVTDPINGCSNMTDVVIDVSLSPAVPNATANGNTEACLSGSLSMSASGSLGDLQWQNSADGVIFSDIPLETGANYTTPTISSTTYYRVAASCGGSGHVYSNVITFTINNPTISSSTGDTRCGPGVVNLSATSASTDINWYENASGGLSLFNGANFSTNVTTTTTYYAAASSGGGTGFVGPVDNTIGTSASSTITTAQSMFFRVLAPSLDIITVDFFPTATIGSNYQFSIKDSTTGTVVYTSPVFQNTVTGGAMQTLNINATLATGSYTMGAITNPGMHRNSAGAVYPYTLPGVVSITGNTFNAVSYYWWYNWQVSTGCEGARVPVTATVTAPPAITAIGNTTICEGITTQISVTSPNDPDYDYVWTPGNLNGAIQNVTPSVSTVYTVTATDNTAGPNAGCTNIATVTVTVNPTPLVSTSVVTSPLCEGSSTQLNSTVSNTGATFFQVGTGTAVNTDQSYPAPYGQYYEGARHQMLMTAAELTSAGLTAGQINSMALNVTATNGSGVHKDFTIKMAATALTALTTTFQTSGFAQVFGPVDYTPVLGLNVHEFASNFTWNGTSNVIVEICFNSNIGATDDWTFNASTTYSTTAFNSVTYYNVDNSTTVCTNTTGTTSTNRTNMRFTQPAPVTYSWSPAGSLDNAAIANPIATPSSTTLYTLSVTNTVNGCIGTSDVQVVVFPAPSAVISPAGPVNLCFGDQVTLSAGSGAGYTYLWSTFETTQSIIVDQDGSYTVTISAPGCNPVNSAPVDVIVNFYAFTPTINSSVNNSPCPGASYDLTAVGPPDSLYTWLGPNGFTANTQSVNVLESGIYTVTVDSAGCSSFPVSINITTNQCQVCATPTGLAHSNVGAGSADISWSPAFVGDEFLIRYWDMATGIYQYKNIPPGQTTNMTTLDYLDWQNTTYVWQVKTICASPQPYSMYSVTDTFTTVAGASMPCNYRPILPTTLGVTATTADLIWYPVDADAFIVRYAIAGTFNYKYQAVSGGIGNPSATQLVGLLPSTDYNWWVLGICNGVKSRYSVMGNFQTDAGSIPCIKPFDTRGINIGTTTATVEWNSIVTADEFRVRYVVNGPAPWIWKYKTVSGVPNVDTIALTGLTPNTTYRFQVQTICSGIKSDYSAVEFFTTLAIPSGQSRNITEEVRGSLSLTAYPNPARDNVTVSFGSENEGGKYVVRLLDLSGRMLMERNGTAPKGQYQEEFKLEGLSAGMYLLEVRIGEKQGFLRLTVE